MQASKVYKGGHLYLFIQTILYVFKSHAIYLDYTRGRYIFFLFFITYPSPPPRTMTRADVCRGARNYEPQTLDRITRVSLPKSMVSRIQGHFQRKHRTAQDAPCLSQRLKFLTCWELSAWKAVMLPTMPQGRQLGLYIRKNYLIITAYYIIHFALFL